MTIGRDSVSELQSPTGLFFIHETICECEAPM